MTLQYAVKVVCGRSTGGALARGAYSTTVSLRNPAAETVQLGVAFAASLPGASGGRVSPSRAAALGPGEALELDCAEMRDIAELPEGLLRGFLVVDSAAELDAVALYTVAGDDGDVRAVHLERVPARR